MLDNPRWYEHVVSVAPRMELREITPAIAHYWLVNFSKNFRNRRITKGTVEKYKRSMLAGRWDVQGSSISFNTSGDLMDGQHRLQAVVESQVSIQTFVVFGLATNVFVNIDTGRVRTFANTLESLGESNTRTQAGIIGFLCRYERENHSFRQLYAAQWESPSRDSQIDFLDKHRDQIADAIGMTHKRKLDMLMPKSQAGALYYLCREKDLEKASTFFEHLADGDNLPKGSPPYELRERLLRLRKGELRVKPGTITTTFSIIFMLVTAWNRYRHNRTIHQRSFNWDGKPGTLPELM